jgi:hypothetical protein
MKKGRKISKKMFLNIVRSGSHSAGKGQQLVAQARQVKQRGCSLF